MRRLITLLLCACLLLGLCACTASQNADSDGSSTTGDSTGGTGSFSVGYGKADITPDTSVPMGGYGRSDQRMSSGMLSLLWVTCIAITDSEGNTLLLYGMDLCSPTEAYRYAADVSEATGVPVENIVMSASHTHSAPDLGMAESPAISQALLKVKSGLVSAAEDAMADRKDARMYCATAETEGLNFVRHYIMNDGTYAGANFGDHSSGYAGHVTEADPIMQLIKFVREGDNDIILTNFQTHPHRTGGSTKYDISADIVGEYRDAMAAALGCEVIYFSGAGGNINPISNISSENVTKDFKEQGQALARYAQTAEYTEIATGKVQASSYTFTAEVNHEFDSVAFICKELRTQWNNGEITTAELIELGKSYGLDLHSPYHAGAIASRASMDKTGSFTIWTYSFGDVGFVAAPYEMFDTNGVFIKENSPFEMTIVATLSNQGNGYFPSELTFDYGSYEVDTTKYVRGTAERLADQYVSMLSDLYANK